MSNSVSDLEKLKGMLRQSGASKADDAAARELLDAIEAAAQSELARQDPDNAHTTRQTGTKKNR
jgi:hypothetical protein